MNCYKYEDLIVMSMDKKLSYFQRKHLLKHLKKCKHCEEYYTNSLILDIGLQDIFEEVEKQTLKKPVFTLNRYIVAICLSLLLSIGLIKFDTVAASVEKALNLVLAQKFDNMNKLPKDFNLTAVEQTKNGEEIKTFISGNNERSERKNGDFEVITPNTRTYYNKKLNTFVLEKVQNNTGNNEKEILEEIKPEKIRYLGSSKFFKRNVDKYFITEGAKGNGTELWFDHRTNYLIREIEVINGNKYEDSKIVSLNFNSNLSENLFSISPPKGAKVVDTRDKEKMSLEEKENYKKVMNVLEP
ncbi:hypothetical protein ABE112_27790 [Priestia aryabhattai]|uniref:LolA family protein n=1 Tax=Priestia TaxID=2800373 RepID=UPI001E4977B3|nr:hypothetical protein [Priestia megaterium]MCE4093209.1 hypothetical protein [Priestia megaterium]